ncbi:hypothetical protein AB0L70_12475 [Kribbella sp. NPDC051952]|uniref:hypothetical protein n=1 Tax=Kribbella sp. NPDC051952 TaxID=3154851 RepID=UPI0034387ED4
MSKDPVGSVAEEAAKLFAVLQQAADTTRTPPAGSAPEAEARPEAHEHTHDDRLGPDCVWCPVCQLINKVRNTSPETIEQLSTAAAHVLGSVRSLLEAAAEAARQTREDAASRPAANETVPEEDGPVRSRVDRIDVSEDPEPWD